MDVSDLSEQNDQTARASALARYGHSVSFREAFWTWTRIASLSFGGPAGQIALMYRVLVEEKRWISERRFLHALNYCMLLPGPEAHQLAVYIGWLLHRTLGGIVAGVLFVLPGLIALGLLSWIYVSFGTIGIVQGLFFGLQAAVLALVFEAVLRIGNRALKSNALIAIAAAAFIGIYFFQLPFPLIVLSAGTAGFVGSVLGVPGFGATPSHAPAAGTEGIAVIDEAFGREVPAHVRPSLRRLFAVASLGIVIWLGPVLALYATAGSDNVFTTIGVFTSKMAMVTFGGAYAVLAYMAQQAVENYRWLTPDEMLVGLGFAETTPGPLISVVQFVGFIAAYRDAGLLHPVLAGTLGGMLAMWCTFVPSFLWIFLGAPYMEAVTGKKVLGAALSAITAAVVGVILNLAVWFALRTLFARMNVVDYGGLALQIPVLTSVNWLALLVSALAVLAIFQFKLGMIRTLALCSALGAIAFLDLDF